MTALRTIALEVSVAHGLLVRAADDLGEIDKDDPVVDQLLLATVYAEQARDALRRAVARAE